MEFKALVSVGNYDFPEPSTYKGTTSTIVDSARNAQGIMIGSVVRDDVGKVEMTWKYLSVADWANINKCFKEAAGGNFINQVDFFDQTTGDWVSRKMYVGDRKCDAWRRDSSTGELLGWTNCSLSLIEV